MGSFYPGVIVGSLSSEVKGSPFRSNDREVRFGYGGARWRDSNNAFLNSFDELMLYYNNKTYTLLLGCNTIPPFRCFSPEALVIFSLISDRLLIFVFMMG